MSSFNRTRNRVTANTTSLNLVSASAAEAAGVQFMSINTVLSGNSPINILVSGSTANNGITASLPIAPSNGQRFVITRVHPATGTGMHVAQQLIVSGSGLGGSPADTANHPIQGSTAITTGQGICIDKASGSAELIYSSDTTMWHVVRITGSTDWIGSV